MWNQYPQCTWRRVPFNGLPCTIPPVHSEPGSALLTLFKSHVRITGTAEDTELTRFLNTAARRLEEQTERLLLSATVTEYYDLWPFDYYDVWHLNRAPVSAVSAIKYYDSDGNQQTWSASNYNVDLLSEPARIVCAPSATLVSPALQEIPNAVSVSYTAGYGATVSSLDQATLNAIFVYAAWLAAQGRELQPGTVPPIEVQRCWYHEIARLMWKL